MKKLILIFPLIVAVILGAFLLTPGEKKTMKIDGLPWQVEKIDENRLAVMGIVLGESTPWHAIHAWNGRADVGLFEGPDQTLRLEAFFGKLKIGVFDAYVVARLAADEQTLAHLYSVKLKRNPMPSGNYKYELPEKELSLAHDFIIEEITYVPMVDYTADIVSQRFGEPAEVKKLGEGRELRLFPDLSMAMILDDKDKDILHYVTPARFEELVERLERGKD